MKNIEDMPFEEMVEWAEGHILKELIKGNLHGAVWTVCNITRGWNNKPLRQRQKKKPSSK